MALQGPEGALTAGGLAHGLIPELEVLERLIEMGGRDIEVQTHASTAAGTTPSVPVYTVLLGESDPNRPAVALFGGVHGLERIGTQVVLAFLHSLVARLRWDDTLHRQLEAVRLVFMPLVNPGGMLRGTRANPNGVDLMRNAPVEATGAVPFLVGGQRISAGLPWYRGVDGAPMEAESQALCDLVRRELHPRPFSLSIDCHSGFGMRDRVWFPFAHRRAPIHHLEQMHALHQIFQQSNIHHPYLFEPQSSQYLAHGDLWDHLYLLAQQGGDRVFLPLTLEMGSWLWVKKNPRQLFSRRGIFNPLIEHREHRVLRRHFALFDFAMRAAAGFRRWLPPADERPDHRRLAMDRWYAGPG